MKLSCFALAPDLPPLVPADPLRDWMDAFTDRHAYRCLPLSIANTHGWEVLSPRHFRATWNGGMAADDIVIEALDDKPYLEHFVSSHFTRGIITMHTGYLFRTEPGWNLMATGPFNRPKDGIAPLTGVIETDWLPYPFTMNWQFTRPGSITFAAGEPYCLIYVVPQDAQANVEPEIRSLESDPELAGQYAAWREQREAFMVGFRKGDEATLKQAWQRFYFRGRRPDSDTPIATHTSKLRLKAPVDRR